ncbi:MAG: decarboxylase, partial [Planctomycetes bacterium]|nr:decarboxylase [Planctomycetota bacterium]
RIAELDLNNLPDTDTLHCPSGPILEAERLLAAAYGVEQSFLLVGGSTVGNVASVLSACRPRESLLVQRNSHKSVIAGVIQAGVRPVWLPPHVDPDYGIAHGLSADQVDAAFREHPQARGLFALNPTYFGTVPDIRALRRVCDRHGKLLLVDQAHGPHFRFHPDLPCAAEDAGADLVVQSTHKLLSALSQAAVLHRGTARVEEARIRMMLQLLQTTSPNFAIMASIDLARRQMATEGRSRWEGVIGLARSARERLAALPGIRLLGREAVRGDGSGLYALDETKLVIGTRGLGLSGGQVQAILNREHGIQPELAGPSYLLCILTVGSRAVDLDRLVDAFRAISERRLRGPEDGSASGGETGGKAVIPSDLDVASPREMPEPVLLPREAFFAPSTSIPVGSSAGRVCAEVVTPYPPGIPVLVPGERVSPALLGFLASVRRAGCPISASDPSFATLRVVAESGDEGESGEPSRRIQQGVGCSRG